MDYLFQELLHNKATNRKSIATKELSANLDVTSTPLITEQEIIFGTADRGVFALDKSTLFNKWKAETSPSLCIYCSLFHHSASRS